MHRPSVKPRAAEWARRVASGGLALVIGSVLLGSCARRERPNILLVVIDTLRVDRVGAYGSRRGVTPFMDSLAARGTVFRRAYATSSWTNPSVASLLTSRHQSQHGVVSFASHLPDDERTLPEVLRAAGYRTGGFSANSLLAKSFGFGQGYDEYVAAPLSRTRTEQYLWEPKRAPELNAAALAWLDSLPDEGRGPVFLYVQYMEPHTPYVPSEAVLRRIFPDGPVPDPAEVSGMAYFGMHFPLDAHQLSLVKRMYDAEVLSVDQGLHALLDELGRRGFLDDALVVITADHGEEFYDHGLLGHGKTLFEEVIHVPLLVLVPGRSVPVSVDEVVSLIDVAPTILDWIGKPIPNSFEGRSLEGSLASAGGGWLDRWRGSRSRRSGSVPAFGELLEEESGGVRRSPHLRSVVDGWRKLIAGVDGEREFYDLAADPKETGAPALDAADRQPLERLLAEFVARVPRIPERPTPLPVDPETRERMRALGYE
jgi:arylsulfatase A-like enzyme